MATSRKFRVIFLCVTSLLSCCCASAPLASHSRSRSWFDLQLEIKTQSLLVRSDAHDPRSQLIAIGLLNEIYALREQVSDPSRVDALLRQFADGVTIPGMLQGEARLLSAVIGGSRDDVSQDEIAKSLIKSLDEAQKDPEILHAVASINLAHEWSDPATLERAAELSNQAADVYKLARWSSDEYSRSRALRKTLELDSNYVPAIIDMARQYSVQGQPTRARLLIKDAHQKNPQDTSISALFAEMEIAQGHGSDAVVTMNQIRSAPLPIAVARSLASSYAQLGFLTEARNLAQLAFKLHPAGAEEQELKARLDAQTDEEFRGRSPQSEESPTLAREHDDANEIGSDLIVDSESERLRQLLHGGGEPAGNGASAFFANAPELIAKWRALPAKQRAESRMLADIRVDQLRSDYQTVQRVQQVIAIGSSGDIATYRNRTIQYSPRVQQLNVSRARAHHLDGRSAEGEDLGENSVADASIAMYYDLRARYLRFGDLRAGDVIELEYTITPLSGSNPYGQYFAQLVAFGGALACDLQRYVLRAPSDIHLSSAEHLVDPVNVRREGDQNVYLWEKQNARALVRESRSPSWSEQGAYIHISNFDSWQALGEWYGNLVRPQFRLNAELENMVRELTARHPNRLGRVAAIDELVLKSTRYVALEFGVYGFKPYPVTQTYARRFGDCKDKASLMVALLRAAGIEADIALVRTQRLGDILPTPASASIFDHAIVYVPEFELWLDGTAEFARLRELPVEDQGVLALTIDAQGNAILRRTPASSAGDNYSRRTIDARLETDGTIHFSGATYVRGEDAPELRRNLGPGDSKVGYVRDRLAQVLPAVEIQKVDLPQNSADAVSLSFSGDLASFRGRHMASLPSSWMERNYVASLAPGYSRDQDLLLPAPWTTDEEIHVQLPKGARVIGLPKNQTITTDFGKAELSYQIEGSELRVLTSVEFHRTRIPESEYAGFREFAARVEEAFHRDIQVEFE